MENNPIVGKAQKQSGSRNSSLTSDESSEDWMPRKKRRPLFERQRVDGQKFLRHLRTLSPRQAKIEEARLAKQHEKSTRNKQNIVSSTPFRRLFQEDQTKNSTRGESSSLTLSPISKNSGDFEARNIKIEGGSFQPSITETPLRQSPRNNSRLHQKDNQVLEKVTHTQDVDEEKLPAIINSTKVNTKSNIKNKSTLAEIENLNTSSVIFCEDNRDRIHENNAEPDVVNTECAHKSPKSISAIGGTIRNAQLITDQVNASKSPETLPRKSNYTPQSPNRTSSPYATRNSQLVKDKANKAESQTPLESPSKNANDSPQNQICNSSPHAASTRNSRLLKEKANTTKELPLKNSNSSRQKIPKTRNDQTIINKEAPPKSMVSAAINTSDDLISNVTQKQKNVETDSVLKSDSKSIREEPVLSKPIKTNYLLRKSKAIGTNTSIPFVDPFVDLSKDKSLVKISKKAQSQYSKTKSYLRNNQNHSTNKDLKTIAIGTSTDECLEDEVDHEETLHSLRSGRSPSPRNRETGKLTTRKSYMPPKKFMKVAKKSIYCDVALSPINVLPTTKKSKTKLSTAVVKSCFMRNRMNISLVEAFEKKYPVRKSQSYSDLSSSTGYNFDASARKRAKEFPLVLNEIDNTKHLLSPPRLSENKIHLSISPNESSDEEDIDLIVTRALERNNKNKDVGSKLKENVSIEQVKRQKSPRKNSQMVQDNEKIKILQNITIQRGNSTRRHISKQNIQFDDVENSVHNKSKSIENLSHNEILNTKSNIPQKRNDTQSSTIKRSRLLDLEDESEFALYTGKAKRTKTDHNECTAINFDQIEMEPSILADDDIELYRSIINSNKNLSQLLSAICKKNGEVQKPKHSTNSMSVKENERMQSTNKSKQMNKHNSLHRDFELSSDVSSTENFKKNTTRVNRSQKSARSNELNDSVEEFLDLQDSQASKVTKNNTKRKAAKRIDKLFVNDAHSLDTDLTAQSESEGRQGTSRVTKTASKPGTQSKRTVKKNSKVKLSPNKKISERKYDTIDYTNGVEEISVGNANSHILEIEDNANIASNMEMGETKNGDSDMITKSGTREKKRKEVNEVKSGKKTQATKKKVNKGQLKNRIEESQTSTMNSKNFSNYYEQVYCSLPPSNETTNDNPGLRRSDRARHPPKVFSLDVVVVRTKPTNKKKANAKTNFPTVVKVPSPVFKKPATPKKNQKRKKKDEENKQQIVSESNKKKKTPTKSNAKKKSFTKCNDSFDNTLATNSKSPQNRNLSMSIEMDHPTSGYESEGQSKVTEIIQQDPGQSSIGSHSLLTSPNNNVNTSSEESLNIYLPHLQQHFVLCSATKELMRPLKINPNIHLSNAWTQASIGVSCGDMLILPASKKQMQRTLRSNLIFIVYKGEATIEIENIVYRRGVKGKFFIPVGTLYTIMNESRDEELRLFYVKMKQ